jgi:glutamyl-tRNA synthetase
MRIAVLNYLFARRNQGKFVLRIDDTDSERSTRESEDSILEDLKWMDIRWDEFYRQSANFEKYILAFERLKKIGRVYPCYETKEELSLRRKIQMSAGIPPIYDRASLHLTEQMLREKESQGIAPHWRFKLNESQAMEWNDSVHRKISISLCSISDPILIKPDGSFVYTFASVVDDINMGITHVIRGDDHITNTAAQINIFQAIAGEFPQFAHVPLMSSLDGQDVSKRSGSSLSIGNMRKSGIDPRSIWCVLSTLGTSHNASHLDSLEKLIAEFSFEKMSLSSPKFNLNEVKLLTKKIISEKSFDEVKNDLEKINIKNISEEFWNVVRGNLDSLEDTVFWHNVLFNKIDVIKEDENFVNQMLKTLKNPIDFDQWIKDLKQVSGRKGRDLFHPVRIVLTGLNVGPELSKIARLMGYEQIKSRLTDNLNAKP